MDVILLQAGSTDFNPPYGQQANINLPVAPTVAGFDIKQCIQLVSVEQGLSQQVSIEIGKPRTSGPPAISEFTCVKLMDKTSPRFFDHCTRAVPLGIGHYQPTYIHIISTAADNSTAILSFALRDTLISSIEVQAGITPQMTERFTLNFTEVVWTYQQNGPDGKPANHIQAGWSSLKNMPIMQFTD